MAAAYDAGDRERRTATYTGRGYGCGCVWGQSDASRVRHESQSRMQSLQHASWSFVPFGQTMVRVQQQVRKQQALLSPDTQGAPRPNGPQPPKLMISAAAMEPVAKTIPQTTHATRKMCLLIALSPILTTCLELYRSDNGFIIPPPPPGSVKAVLQKLCERIEISRLGIVSFARAATYEIARCPFFSR